MKDKSTFLAEQLIKRIPTDIYDIILDFVMLKLLLTSGGFTSVAAFGTEYSRLDRTKLWKKVVHFTKEAAIA
ncbi:hypothetical protein HYN49_13695 [Flavobacterium pallidum]|uniref:Uncharacterized protein n=1 Tax=Flavobacterium pallidum TaxID=2172098 RepID=A0A2S1SKD2_9FLAO|nr:hypothetical protein HYN49_13695 [Flavobacterium pallidum]